GLGSHKSQQDAAYWFEKGAQLGHADACYNYAVCLQKGIGTSQNKRAAISYLKKAAELGHLRAKKMLEDQ
ncbi:MAG: sel1 repeat family protein, partial [Muribaculaceae bacterium]|nr:sel1 repeat family protein [Muribaculaceae bacterium]